MGFRDATGSYECCNHTEYIRLRMHHSRFYSFSKGVSALQRAADEQGASDDFVVNRLLNLVARYRSQVSAAPISFSRAPALTGVSSAMLDTDLEMIQAGWPRLADDAAETVRAMFELATEDGSPYIDCLACCRDCLGATNDEAIVISATNLIAPARETVDDIVGKGELTILSPSDLKSDCRLDQLVLAGPFGWFVRYAEHVLSAPRAKRVVSLSYDWLSDSWKPSAVFISPERGSAAGVSVPRSVECHVEYEVAAVRPLDDAEVLPTVEPARIARMTPRHQDEEPVRTRGFLLEPASLVLVEDTDDSKHLVIDLEREPGRQVTKVFQADIVPGMFMLRRSSGSGDFIVDVADKIMGGRKDYLRSRQREWKARLRRSVKIGGYDSTVRRLSQLGSPIANYQNLRNWLSPRSIRTHSFEDFQAIMALVDFEREADKLWDEMGLIKRAHLKAGSQITKMLLKLVSGADADELERLGFMEFDLGGEDGGALTAQRVLGLVDNTPEWLADELPVFLEV